MRRYATSARDEGAGMSAKVVEWLIVAPFLIGFLLVSWWVTSESHKRLDDPDDDRTVHLERLREILRLEPFGSYRVTILRQSGNVHAEKVVTGTAQDALEVALATLRRAKIDAVHVGVNSEAELRIGRLYHDHRGRNEGKKVGRRTSRFWGGARGPLWLHRTPILSLVPFWF